MSSDSVVGLSDLVQHLDALLAPSPAVELTPDLFDDVKLRVTEDNAGTVAGAVMDKLVALLQSPVVAGGQGARVNTEAVCSLARKLLQQPFISFSDAIAMAPMELLRESMKPGATPATNKLAIAVIEKAVGPRLSPTWSPSRAEARNLASLVQKHIRLFDAFIESWLLNPDIGVGEYSERVLLRLLDADWPRDVLGVPIVRISSGGESTNGDNGAESSYRPGRVWHCLLKDERIYDKTIITYCRETITEYFGYEEVNETPDEDGQIKTPQSQSTAQSRVLSILPRLACLNLPLLTDSRDSLLYFAANNMVEMRDNLMFRNLQVFFRDLVANTRCFLAESDLRNSIKRADRPHFASVDNIHDQDLRYQVETMVDILRSARLKNPRLVPTNELLVAEWIRAVETGQTTQEDADDMRQWVNLVLPKDNLPIR